MRVVCFYTNDIKNKGPFFPASQNKLNYIFGCLKPNVEKIEILSLTNVSLNGKAKGSEIFYDENTTIYYPKSLPRNNIINKLIYKIWNKKLIYKFLKKNLSNCKKGEVVYVYHMAVYHSILSKLLRKFHLKMILEVEEIYGDVFNNKKLRKREFKFFNKADGYLFASKELNALINHDNRPYAILYGPYQFNDFCGQRRNDDLIHCVYSGILDLEKGCNNAINAALYLDGKFHIHILGYGTDKQKNEILSLIENVSKQTKCLITFDGLKTGKEYDEFLRTCDIGLCTQNPNAKFNGTSFPSKLLAYISNNLKVVSVKTNIIEDSPFKQFITFYNINSPQCIADAIRRATFENTHDAKNVLSTLDKRFKSDLKVLIGMVEHN